MKLETRGRPELDFPENGQRASTEDLPETTNQIELPQGDPAMIASNINLIQDSARKAIVRLHADEKGQGMTEYVIILVAIAVV